MTDKPRLIEHAFPLKQASLDSVHEKNVRHGHISTLHIWPARRPLAACLAAIVGKFNSRLVCMLNPFGNLLTRAKGSVMIFATEVSFASRKQDLKGGDPCALFMLINTK